MWHDRPRSIERIALLMILMAVHIKAELSLRDLNLTRNLESADLNVPSCPVEPRPECQAYYVNKEDKLAKADTLLRIFGRQPIWHIYWCIQMNPTVECMLAAPNSTALNQRLRGADEVGNPAKKQNAEQKPFFPPGQ